MRNLSEINTNCIEGRLLIAALSSLSGFRTQSEPDELLKEVEEISNSIYKDNPLPVQEESVPTTFEHELTSLLNRFSKENESDTPDFILSNFVQNALKAYEDAVKARDKWFGVNMWDKTASGAKWHG